MPVAGRPDGLGEHGPKPFQPGYDVGAEMDPQGEPPACGKHVEVTSRLCFFRHPEAVAVPGYGHLDRVVAGDLRLVTNRRTTP